MLHDGLELDILEARLRRAEHALLRAIPRRALKAIWATQQILPARCGEISTRQRAPNLDSLLSSQLDEAGPQPARCLLCHDPIDGKGGVTAHFGLESDLGPRCAVLPAIIDIMRECTAKRAEDGLERERWRRMNRS